MKKWVLRGVGGIFIVAVVVGGSLAAASRRADRGRNAAEVEIARPPAHVWRYLEDQALVKQWISGLTEIRPLNETRGVGARERLVVVMDDQRTDMDMELTAVEPLRRMAFRLEGAGAAAGTFTEDAEYRLEERGGRTWLRLAAMSRYHGAV